MDSARLTPLARFAGLVLVVGLLAVPAKAAGIAYADFADTTGLSVNGSGFTLDNGVDSGEVLRLAFTGNRGTAFTEDEVCLNSFSTTFAVRISNPSGGADPSGQNGADGMTFVLHGDDPTSVGIGGGELGLGGITPSVAVELDIWQNGWDPDSNHVGVNINGSTVSLVTAPVAGRFDDGELWTIWIDYDGVDLDIRVDPTGVRPASPTLSVALDIGDLLGSDTGHAGFTASVGASAADHDVVSWSYQGYCACDADGFECGDDAGGTMDAVFQGAIFTVVGSPGPAVLFATDAPTCEDDDLQAPGYGIDNVADQGNVLIVQETSSDCLRDDEADGGTLTFDFIRPIDFVSVGLLDVDEAGGTVTVIAPGAVPCVADIPALDDNNWQEVACELSGVTQVIVELAGSGAVTGFGCASGSPRPAMQEVVGTGVSASGVELQLDAYGHESGWATGELSLSAPALLEGRRADRASRRVETLRRERALGSRRDARSSSRRGPVVTGHELRGRVSEMTWSDGRLVVRGDATWNGAGRHGFELRLHDGGAQEPDRFVLTVRAPGGAVVATFDEVLVEDRLFRTRF